MIRAAFLVERSGEQLSCALNPTELVFKRTAGVGRRRALSGSFTAGRSPDEPLVYTGGGRTELDLDLIFDVSIPGSTVRSEDVRDLTARLWQLSENADLDAGLARLPTVRFVWGKAWNFPGVVAAVAERFEMFDANGVPRRSWLRLKLVRVDERATPAVPAPDPEVVPALPDSAPPEGAPSAGDFTLPDDEGARLAAAEGGPYRRVDNEAHWLLGDAGRWRELILAHVADPLGIPVAPRAAGTSEREAG